MLYNGPYSNKVGRSSHSAGRGLWMIIERSKYTVNKMKIVKKVAERPVYVAGVPRWITNWNVENATNGFNR